MFSSWTKNKKNYKSWPGDIFVKISNIQYKLMNFEFNCMVRDFLCPWHWLLIAFNIMRNCTQKFVLVTLVKLDGQE